MSAIYDNWERLVAAAVKKQQLWELFHQPASRSPSILSEDSDWNSSFRDLSFRNSDLAGSSSGSQNWTQKLVLVSDYWPDFDVKDAALASVELLGTGTFGRSYLATMDDRQRFVVKRLPFKSEGVAELNFKRIVQIVADVRHENVIALRAYYSSSDEKLMLYDYFSSGSVYTLLHGTLYSLRPSLKEYFSSFLAPVLIKY